jgi:peroxiredoxin Q/BCP
MKNSIPITIVWVILAACGVAQGEDMLDAGTTFPTFALEAHDRTTVRTDDLEGTPFLIYYYPKADTPGCTKEACELRDSWSDLKAEGLKVFGVSYDAPEDNKAFAEKYSLPFLLLSDSTKELAETVGASRLLLPFPKRISYLVGADGAILKAYPSVKPSEHAAQVLEDFKTLTK